MGVLLRKCCQKGVGVQIKATKNNMGVQLKISLVKTIRPVNLLMFSFLQLFHVYNLQTIRNLPYIMFLVAVI